MTPERGHRLARVCALCEILFNAVYGPLTRERHPIDNFPRLTLRNTYSAPKVFIGNVMF